MNLSNFCIKHRVATLLAVILTALFGLLFGTQLQVSLMPEVEAPMSIVFCYYNGANPSDMEELVTRPLEGAIMSTSGVDSVSSTSSDGVSQIQVTYVEDTNLDLAAAKLREQFNQVSLPDGAIDPVIVNLNISDMMPTASIGLLGDDLAALQQLAEDTVCPALERIDGVAQVTINGGVEQQIEVRLDPTRAAGLGLSNSYLSQYLAGQNLLYPGGDLESGSKTLTVSTNAKYQSVEDVANTLVALPSGGSVRLSEVADVSLVSSDTGAVAKVDGSACVVLQVSKQSGANEVATADAVVERMASLQEENPAIHYSIPYVVSDYIDLAIDAAFSNIVQGMILAAFVVFLFLRRGSATLTIILSMPVCILSVLILMHTLGLTLNMMSLGGVAMGVGMIVDNSIVVLENIYRFSSEGRDRMSACVDGTKEVVSSVVASTLTTLAVFVPLGLVEGLVGMLFRDFCLTIASLIFASLVISLTLVPLLCYFTLSEEQVRRHQLALERKKDRKPFPPVRWLGNFFQKVNNLYLRLLKYFVYHLKTGLLCSVALVLLFALTLLSTKTVMMPDVDQGTLSISVTMPIGSELEETAAIADRISTIVQEEVPELDNFFYVSQDESVTLMMNLVPKDERSRSSFDIADDLPAALQEIAGCEISVSAASAMGSMSGEDIHVELSGSDYDTLAFLANDLTEQIAALPDAVNVENSLSETVPQVTVSVNREAAAQYGLTAAAIGSAVRSELTGSTATAVTLNNQELDVVVKGNGSAATSLDALRSMPVPSALGGTVPLGAVADVVTEQAPQSITRADQSRQVTISGDTLSGDSSAITQEIQAILDQFSLPAGYSAETGGSHADVVESFGKLFVALAVALGLVYFVLAAQFESFAMPIIIMMILPVAFTGALFILPLTGRDLSMMALVSIIMLAGTVVNASIILVEYIKIRRRMGESREEAILHACPLRVRPVLMTTLTTILAMIPMALALGNTSEIMTDMGLTMISGMAISTVVTLLFTPVYYSIIDTMIQNFRRRKKRPEQVLPEDALEAPSKEQLDDTQKIPSAK